MAEYSEEIRAQCLAALLAGQSPALIAQQYGVPVGTLRSWKSRSRHGDPVATLQRESRDRIGVLLMEYLETTFGTMIAQQELFKNAEWLRKQSAAELATLHGISFDKALQILEAFDHADEDEDDADRDAE